MQSVAQLEEVVRDARLIPKALEEKHKKRLAAAIEGARAADPLAVGRALVRRKLSDASRPTVPPERRAAIEAYVAGMPPKRVAALGRHHVLAVVAAARPLLRAPPEWFEMNVL
jgi:hypothetical protein